MIKYVMRESAQLGSFFLNKGAFLYATPFTSADETGMRTPYPGLIQPYPISTTPSNTSPKRKATAMSQQRSQAPSRNRTFESYLNTWETDTQLQILREIRACNQRVDSLRSDVAWATLIITACLFGLCVIVWIACF